MPAPRQGEFGTGFDAGVEPGAGVTEAFADIVLQVTVLGFGGGLTQFSSGAGDQFIGDEGRVLGSAAVAEVSPDKMKDLVREDEL